MLLLLMWCVFAFNHDMLDDAAYLSRYNNIELYKSSTEILYRYLIIICNRFGLDYIGFRAVSGAIMIILLGKGIWDRAQYPNIVLLLFFFYPFTIYVVQIRSALASAVVFYGSQYLFNNCSYEKKCIWILTKSDLLYILYVIIAAFIHTQSIFWLLFLCGKKLKLKTNVEIMLFVNVCFGVVLTPMFLKKIFNIFGGGNKISEYLTSAYANSSYRKYGPILYIIFAAVLTIFACVYILRRKDVFDGKGQITTLLNVNILMLSVIGIFFRYTSEIYRIQEGSLIINYLYVSNCLKGLSIRKIRLADLKIFAIVAILCTGYLYLSVLHYMTDSVWIPFWFNNSLLHY